jgi:hypothetical protein
MIAGRPKLGAFLLEKEIVSAEQLETALVHQATTGGRLGEALVALGYCTEASIARALAQQLEIPFLDLDETTPSPDCVALLPRSTSHR